MTASGARRALVVCHEQSSRPGLVGERLVAAGFELDVHVTVPDTSRPDLPEPLPAVDGHDLVVSTGSYWSVYDTDTIGAWIGDEIELLGAAHRAGIPVFGICFGGQALAAALGGSVEAAPEPEIGWYGIDAVPGRTPPGEWLCGSWLEWHHDRIVAPPAAEVVATTPIGPQVFRAGRSLGLQFHPEVTAALVAEWLSEADDDYLAAHGVVRDDFLATVAEHEPANRRNCTALVDWFLTDVADLR